MRVLWTKQVSEDFEPNQGNAQALAFNSDTVLYDTLGSIAFSDGPVARFYNYIYDFKTLSDDEVQPDGDPVFTRQVGNLGSTNGGEELFMVFWDGQVSPSYQIDVIHMPKFLGVAAETKIAGQVCRVVTRGLVPVSGVETGKIYHAEMNTGTIEEMHGKRLGRGVGTDLLFVE
jgi:hypothetical protein